MFLTTQWSLVRAAGRQGAIGSDTTARAALESLCQSYWTPLYRYARRSGHRAEDAEDLVQGLFANLLSGNSFLNVKEENGKFRAYLLAAMKNPSSKARWLCFSPLARLGRGGEFPPARIGRSPEPGCYF